MEEENVYVGAEQYTGGQNNVLTFREIILNHFRKILNLQSCEMRGGFWVHKTKMAQGTSMETKEYIPDTREEFGGSIDALHDALLPYFDNKMSKVAEETNQQLENIKKECLAGTKKDDKEIMPSENYSGQDKQVVEEYRYRKLTIKRKMFQQLSLLLKRLKYLEGKTFEGSE